MVPLFTVVRTMILEPTLKLACEPQQSPKTLYSAICQPDDRLTTLSLSDVAYIVVPVEKETVSIPPLTAVPDTLRLPRFDSVWTGIIAALLFLKQWGPNVFHPVGHVP